MWKKDERPDESVPQRPGSTSTSAPMPAPAPAFAPSPAPSPSPASSPAPAPASASAEHAIIGRSITIRGDVTGDEDLVIQGRVEGSVDLQQHSVTVGRDGEVIASIIGRVVTIEGRVEGNVSGGEQVLLRASATVKGDIRAPRVVLENGARFRGLVDMGEGEEAHQAAPRTLAGVRPDGRITGENGRAKPEAASSTGATGNGLAAESGTIAPSPTESGGGTAESSKGSSGLTSGKSKKPSEVEA